DAVVLQELGLTRRRDRRRQLIDCDLARDVLFPECIERMSAWTVASVGANPFRPGAPGHRWCGVRIVDDDYPAPRDHTEGGAHPAGGDVLHRDASTFRRFRRQAVRPAGDIR